jgi:hypothetical protein
LVIQIRYSCQLPGEEVVAGRLRRYHRLTEEGAAALLAEAERMRSQAETVAERLRAR